MTGFYHYRESGLDNVFLASGFHYVDTPGGRTVTIQDIDGLHRAIGVALISERKNLSGKEFRFLRTELLLSQASLAKVLGVTELTIARWEKGQSDIPRSSEAIVRMLFAESIGQKQPIRELLDRIADLEDAIDHSLTMGEGVEGWAVCDTAEAA